MPYHYALGDGRGGDNRMSYGSKEALVMLEVERLVTSGIDTLVKVELLCFFHRNPSTVDTARGLALRLGRDVGDVAKGCEELATGEYLRATGSGAGRSFALVRPGVARELCERLAGLMADRNVRLLLTARLVRRPGEPS